MHYLRKETRLVLPRLLVAKKESLPLRQVSAIGTDPNEPSFNKWLSPVTR
jgi:hypothetical protein